ncbi:MAG: hypothetical protein LC772_11060 [Chloroflexi bacterium]|nr:hypothetical protein [Chloroflexota bacterium]
MECEGLQPYHDLSEDPAMRYLGRTLFLTLLAAVLPAGVRAAPSASPTSVLLHATSHVKGKMAFRHVMAAATLRYTKGDVFIKLTTDNLPNAGTLGQRVYVLYASDGGMTDRVGALHVHGAMAGVSGEVMMTRVQHLSVYAEASPNNKRPSGVLVLSGMTG